VSTAVVVIGDALLDVQVTPAGAIRRGSDVPARVTIGPGGQGANVAVRLARRGVRVALVAAVADDGAGSVLRHALVAESIDLRAVPAVASGSVVVLAEPGGERSMLSQRDPFVAAIEPELLGAHGWLVVSGYLLHEPDGADLATRLAGLERRRVLLGCAVPDEGVHAWRAAAQALRPDLLILNRDEAARLVPPGTAGIAVTDAGGAMLTIAGVTVGSVTSVGAPARDTTGAGDAFAAGLIAELLDAGWPPPRERMQDALEAAVALGGRVARVAGAQGRVEGEPPATLPA
jgi:ribokinase